MKLFHSTPTENVESILEKGLIPSGIGIVYLSPDLEHIYKISGRTILEVETGDLKLTAFEDCEEWEVFCWGRIPPENIKIIEEILRE